MKKNSCEPLMLVWGSSVILQTLSQAQSILGAEICEHIQE